LKRFNLPFKKEEETLEMEEMWSEDISSQTENDKIMTENEETEYLQEILERECIR